MFICIMLSVTAQAAEDQLRMITATGRAVISHSDALNEAKNAALEPRDIKTQVEVLINVTQTCETLDFSSSGHQTF